MIYDSDLFRAFKNIDNAKINCTFKIYNIL